MKSQSKAFGAKTGTRVDLEKKVVYTGNKVYRYDEENYAEERVWTRDSTKYFRDGSGERYRAEDLVGIPDSFQETLEPIEVRVKDAKKIKLLNRLVDKAHKAQEERSADARRKELVRLGGTPDVEEEDEESVGKGTNEAAQEVQKRTTRHFLVHETTGRLYQKDEQGEWSYLRKRVVGPDGHGRFTRTHVKDRHLVAELNRQSLRWAVLMKVETPEEGPRSYTKVWSPRRKWYKWLNIIPSDQDPDGFVMFAAKQPVATFSPESFEHFIARQVQYLNEWVLWKKPKENAKEEG